MTRTSRSILLAALLTPIGCALPPSKDAPSAQALLAAEEPPAPSTPSDPSAAARVDPFGQFDGQPDAAIDAPPGATEPFRQHTTLDDGADTDVSVSPDGRWLLFASTRHSERSDLYLQRPDGVSVTQLTSDPADDAFGAFSPDGKTIAFSSNRQGTWDLFICDLDGRNVRQLTAAGAQELHPSFSPDGKRIVYCVAGSRSGQWELWTIDLDTSARRMIGLGLFPSWSPDKSRDIIAFQRARQRGGRKFSVWTLDLEDGEARRVTEVATSGNASLITPTFSPDGSRITFASVVAGADGSTRPQQDLWSIRVDGTDRKRLTDGLGSTSSPVCSSNGRVFFISDRGGHDTVWSVASPAASAQTAAAPQD